MHLVGMRIFGSWVTSLLVWMMTYGSQATDMHLVGMRIFGSQVTSLLGLNVDDDIWEPGN